MAYFQITVASGILVLCLPKSLSGANAFEINDIQGEETETLRVRPLLHCAETATRINSPGTRGCRQDYGATLPRSLLGEDRRGAWFGRRNRQRSAQASARNSSETAPVNV
jgi:hypothetical protein